MQSICTLWYCYFYLTKRSECFLQHCSLAHCCVSWHATCQHLSFAGLSWNHLQEYVLHQPHARARTCLSKHCSIAPQRAFEQTIFTLKWMWLSIKLAICHRLKNKMHSSIIYEKKHHRTAHTVWLTGGPWVFETPQTPSNRNAGVTAAGGFSDVHRPTFIIPTDIHKRKQFSDEGW